MYQIAKQVRGPVTTHAAEQKPGKDEEKLNQQRRIDKW